MSLKIFTLRVRVALGNDFPLTPEVISHQVRKKLVPCYHPDDPDLWVTVATGLNSAAVIEAMAGEAMADLDNDYATIRKLLHFRGLRQSGDWMRCVLARSTGQSGLHWAHLPQSQPDVIILDPAKMALRNPSKGRSPAWHSATLSRLSNLEKEKHSSAATSTKPLTSIINAVRGEAPSTQEPLGEKSPKATARRPAL